MAAFHWVGKSADGETVTLKRFSGQFQLPPYATADWLRDNADRVRTGAVLDVETTGLNRGSDVVIEVGARQFRFNRATGDIIEPGACYSGLQDPGRPLDPQVKRLTGLTDELLAGKSIDWNEVGRLLDGADVVIAHNASFDRPFVDRMCAVSTGKPWGCSLKQIDWHGKGFPAAKLEVLSVYHGFFTDAHRALNDADALLHLLSMNDWATGKCYLDELLANARRPLTRVFAANSPFESKDILKERGYSWDSTQRCWRKTIFRDAVAAETAWLESAVYKGESRATTQEIALTDNFKS